MVVNIIPMSTNNLFILIKSLNPSEKRYFNLYAQRQVQQRNTNYLKVFEAINKQEKYDEEKLIMKFRRENFVKQFSVTKHYLFNMILKGMQEYNEENFIEWKIRNMFLQIKLLASKGLDDDAAKLIKKTKELAWQYEYYHVVMDVLHVERYLFGNFRIYEQTMSVFAGIVKEEEDAFAIAEHFKDVVHVWHYLSLLEQQLGTVADDIIQKQAHEIISMPCMKTEPNTSYTSQFRYYAAWSLYFNLKGSHSENYESCLRCITIREDQIALQPLQNLDAMASYYNFLIACEKADKWDNFKEYLLKIKNLDAPTIEVNIRRMHNYCRCGLMFYLHLQDYEKAYEIVNEYRAFFTEGKIVFRKDFKIYIEAACGLVCFFLHNHKEAMYWWTDILNTRQSPVEMMTQGAVRFYVIMLHSEEKNEDIIDYLAQQAKNFLKQNEIFRKPEEVFLTGITEIAKLNKDQEIKAAFGELYAVMSGFELSVAGNAVNTFIINWLRGKAAEKSETRALR